MKFNADEWVRLAKDAGMKYIVITSKHHDGFAMFQSKASPYNICDATPFKRDPLKELAEACRKQGIKLGFYRVEADQSPGRAVAASEMNKRLGDRHRDRMFPWAQVFNGETKTRDEDRR